MTFAAKLMTAALTAMLCVATARAQTAIAPANGVEHFGETVRVRMKVISVGRAGDQVELHSTASWRDEDCFFVRIDQAGQAAFRKLGFENLPQDFAGKEIEVAGRVQKIKPGGLLRPAIYVSSPENLRVIVPPEPTVVPKAPTNVPQALAMEAIKIEATDALKHVGKKVNVRITVQSIGKGGNAVILNSEDSWEHPQNLQVQIDEPTQAAFAKSGVETPAFYFAKKEIDVTGVVKSINPGGLTRAAIAVDSTDDIQLVLESARPAPALTDLVDRRIELHLRNGNKLGDVQVVGVTAGSLPQSIASLRVRLGDARPRNVEPVTIEEIVVEGIPLDVTYDRKNRVLITDAKKRKARLESAAEIERRLALRGGHVWAWLSEEEHAEWIAQHKEFLASTQQHFSQLPLRVIETKYYLLLTDLDAAATVQYLAYLDAMYEKMSQAFGVAIGRNIWCGKCVVVAFQNQRDFIRFEADIMQNARQDLTKSGGLCHARNNGQVIISVFKGNATTDFAHKLVHETSHGFVARYRSNVRISSWLNEGMADWIAGFIVNSGDRLLKKQRRAAETLLATRTLAGFFEAKQIAGEYYGVAAGMIDVLLRIDPVKFRKWFDAMKDGIPEQQALAEVYGFSYNDLSRLYGRRIGLPNLQP